jgi:hypothetical protein
MNNRKMIPGLRHAYCVDDDVFFQAIDAAGGWPLGFQFVGFEHTTERAAGFTNSPHNDGYWTVIASADDYYIWKLSPDGLQKIIDAALRAIRPPSINTNALSIKSWRGYRAAQRKIC